LYKATTGIRRADGYQKMEESTMMKRKCIELRDFLLNADLRNMFYLYPGTHLQYLK
jgi:hypothetical protein